MVELAKLHANAKLVKDFRIVLDDGTGHGMVIDLPADQGMGIGPSALELALMSYAGCYATIFALTAQKMRIQLKDLEVDVEAVKSEQAGTITEACFDVTVKADARKDRIQRIHELTSRSCPVGKLFDKAGVKTTYSLHAAS